MDEKYLRKEGSCCNFSSLLELAAFDNLVGFKTAIEEKGRNVDETGMWYGRKIGTKKMGFEERTPLMIAAMYGSMDVLSYIIKKGCVDVNRTCGSDGATALHCAVAGSSASAADVVKCLLDASADGNSLDNNGRRPVDLIAPTFISVLSSMKKKVEVILDCGNGIDVACKLTSQMVDIEKLEALDSSIGMIKEEAEKKEYPIDPSFPDIKNGMYGTDEFRMYIFKIKPCSRAYSHDWTECPFVHPGENARRRDPKVYSYSCVPCPEFRKGSCSKGDNCEYSHGIFECWLHPAQYRTRLCKDGTSCTRKVCFFAHQHEELRPLYASTGSALPSSQSYSAGTNTLDMGSMSPLGLASPSIMTPPTPTPPLTPGNSSIIGNTMWQNHCNLVPPILQLPTGKFKRDCGSGNANLDIKPIGAESHFHQQNLTNGMTSTSQINWNNSSSLAASPGDMNAELNRLGVVNATNLDNAYRYFNPEISARLHSPSLNSKSQSPSGPHIKQNINQQLISRNIGMASPTFAIDSPGTTRSTSDSPFSTYMKRSLSFTERSARNPPSGLPSPASSAIAIPSSLSHWSSPNGKLDWSIPPEEINKSKKYSFSFQRNDSILVEPALSDAGSFDEPDVSWVHSLVRDAPSEQEKQGPQHRYNANTRNSDILPAWLEQLQMDQRKNLL